MPRSRLFYVTMITGGMRPARSPGCWVTTKRRERAIIRRLEPCGDWCSLPRAGTVHLVSMGWMRFDGTASRTRTRAGGFSVWPFRLGPARCTQETHHVEERERAPARWFGTAHECGLTLN